uniref:SS18 N-terminal domain-containing protein n=1 Tax=Mus spicilegus TaxID=10103 RepID=A0A8C6HAD7_MUSSI
MSVAFASARPRGKGEVTQQTIQKMLDENHHLIQCILDYQSKGKTAECTQYQQILHRNLVYLATIADSNQNMQSLLPAPPTQNMNLGPGALSQSGSSQGLHPQGSLSDTVSTGLPPASLMQGQIGNGPNHVSMQQTAQSTLPTTSMSLSGSGHGTGPGYSHSGPTSQSVPMQGQGAISNYVSRTNINMQSNPVSMMHQQAATSHYNSAQGGSQHYQGQAPIAMMGQGGQGGSMMGQRPMAPYRPSQQGSSQQYLGQEEYYSEQYSHSQGSAEPMSQQYYPDGHGDYAYQQSSYTEQSYDRSFEDPTQHYYEGGKKHGGAHTMPQCTEAQHRHSGSDTTPLNLAVLASSSSQPRHWCRSVELGLRAALQGFTCLVHLANSAEFDHVGDFAARRQTWPFFQLNSPGASRMAAFFKSL